MFRTSLYVLIIALITQINSSLQCMLHQEKDICFSFKSELSNQVVGLVKEKSEKTYTYIIKPHQKNGLGFKINDVYTAKNFYFVFDPAITLDEKDSRNRYLQLVGRSNTNKFYFNPIDQLPWRSATMGIFLLIKSITPEYNPEGTIKRYVMRLGFKIDDEDENPFNAIYLYTQEADDDDASSDWGS